MNLGLRMSQDRFDDWTWWPAVQRVTPESQQLLSVLQEAHALYCMHEQRGHGLNPEDLSVPLVSSDSECRFLHMCSEMKPRPYHLRLSRGSWVAGITFGWRMPLDRFDHWTRWPVVQCIPPVARRPLSGFEEAHVLHFTGIGILGLFVFSSPVIFNEPFPWSVHLEI